MGSAILGLAPVAQAQSQLTDPSTDTSAGAPTIPYDVSALMKANAEAQTAVYVSQKAAAEAHTAAIEAQVAAAKAGFGSITGQTAITGATELGTGAAKGEALLLVTRANLEAGRTVADRFEAATAKSYPNNDVLVLTDLTQLSTSDAIQYDFQRTALRSMLGAVVDESERALRDAAIAPSRGAAGGSNRMAFLPAFGAAIDAAAKLGSYFLTDYKFGSVDVTEPSNLVAGSIVGALRERSATREIIVPALLVATDADAVLDELEPLHTAYLRLIGLVASVHGRAAALRESAPADAQRLDAVEARAMKTVTAYESFMTALTTTAAGVEMPLVRIVRQKLV